MGHTRIDADGSEQLSRVLLNLLNTFPNIGSDKKILFSTLSETAGIGFFPTSGAAVLTSKRDITGKITQMCQYPFQIIYRAAVKSEAQKLRVKTFLDMLGAWLELQPICIEQDRYQLTHYPSLQNCCVLETQYGESLETEIGIALETENQHSGFPHANRKIKSISRTSTGHCVAAYNDGIEDWGITAIVKYENIFYEMKGMMTNVKS